MPRKLRENVEGGIYHAYARGNGKQVIFQDDEDRFAYLRIFGGVVDRCDWRCLASCLMDNHVHHVIETPFPNLSAGMQLLHGEYAQEFNARHDTVGHLFQGRFGAVRIQSDAQLWTVLAYVAANPVEAGLAARPEDWPWSSYAALIGPGDIPRWLDWPRLRSFLSDNGIGCVDRYRRLVENAKCLAETFATEDAGTDL